MKVLLLSLFFVPVVAYDWLADVWDVDDNVPSPISKSEDDDSATTTTIKDTTVTTKMDTTTTMTTSTTDAVFRGDQFSKILITGFLGRLENIEKDINGLQMTINGLEASTSNISTRFLNLFNQMDEKVKLVATAVGRANIKADNIFHNFSKEIGQLLLGFDQLSSESKSRVENMNKEIERLSSAFMDLSENMTREIEHLQMSRPSEGLKSENNHEDFKNEIRTMFKDWRNDLNEIKPKEKEMKPDLSENEQLGSNRSTSSGFMWSEGLIMMIVASLLVVIVLTACLVMVVLRWSQQRKMKKVKQFNQMLEMKCESYRREIERRGQNIELAVLRANQDATENLTFPGPSRRREDIVPYAVTSLADLTRDPRYASPLRSFQGPNVKKQEMDEIDKVDDSTRPKERKTGLSVMEKSKIMKTQWFARNPNAMAPPPPPPRDPPKKSDV
jgi:type II secretory pathway pseudopilin PulG